MKWKKLFRAAFNSLLKNRMRSILTMLGVIIGVGAVAILVSLGQSAQAIIEEQITALGSNLIIVTPAKAESRGVSAGARTANTLTLEDADALVSQGTELSGVSGMVSAGGQVIGGIGNWATKVQGVSPSYLTVRSWELSEGSFFGEREVQGRAKVAILGQTVADELFPGQSPLGAQIRVRNVPFRVIGVLESKGSSGMGGDDQDDVVLAPVTTVLYRLAGGRNINVIFASAKDAARMDEAEAEVRGIIRSHHRLRSQEADDFRVQNQAEIIEFAGDVLGALTALLGAIAGVSLLVGGIGIMNIMLVSVTERTREIGIRLAVGARGSDVLSQFLVEAVVLCVVGGLAGTGLAFGAAAIASRATEYTVTVGWDVVLLAVGFSAAIGIFFGFYPARKAARLDPIDALRYE
jgi:putative ABC transport system permease protein